MKHRHGHWLICLLLAPWLLLAISCEQDAYEKGEGTYSLMRADFAEAHANGEKQIDYFVTDDGETWQLTESLSPKWITTPDSLYRCFLYYNKVKREDHVLAEPLSIGFVPCASIYDKAKMERAMKTDPVRFESAWISRSGKYLNLSLYLMTGTADDENAKQQLAIVCDTVIHHENGSRSKWLTLYHDQGNVPEYYSTQAYVSLRTQDLDADSVRISIHTYQGLVEKSFTFNTTAESR